MKRTRADLVQRWVNKASKDLCVAKELVKNPSYDDIVCCHSQQACEKALKAHLICLDVVYPKMHELEKLVHITTEKDKSIERFKAKAALLTQYSVNARRLEFIDPTDEEALEVAGVARELCAYIKSIVGAAEVSTMPVLP